jgi:hypothetical protein
MTQRDFVLARKHSGLNFAEGVGVPEPPQAAWAARRLPTPPAATPRGGPGARWRSASETILVVHSSAPLGKRYLTEEGAILLGPLLGAALAFAGCRAGLLFVRGLARRRHLLLARREASPA